MHETPPPHDSSPIAHQLAEPLKDELLQKLSREIKGNTKIEGELSFESYDGHIYECRCTTHIRISANTHRETLKGKQTIGELVSSQEELSDALSKASHITDNYSKGMEIRHFLLDREDKLFAPKEHTHKIPQISKQYCLHQACKTCHSQGSMDCPACHGQGRAPCPSCRSRGHTICPICRGAGVQQTAQGQSTCTQCQGRKQIPCRTCQGRGQAACGKCGAKGKTSCRECTGTGWLTESARLECIAETDFHVGDSKCPDAMKRAIAKKGQKLYRTEALQLSIESPNQGDLESEHGDLLTVNYKAVCPYGTAKLNYGNKSFDIDLIGNSGVIAECPPFVEILAAEGLSELLAAAKAPPQATEKHLNTAKNYRIIREVLILTMQSKPAVAFKLLQKRYPKGVKPQTFKHLIMAARKSFKDLSRASRYKGVALGLLIAAIVQTIYNFSGIRGEIVSGLPLIQELLIDTAVFGLGFILNLVSVEILGRSGLVKTIRKLTGQNLSMRNMHFDKGKTRIWSFLGNVVIVALIWWIATVLGFSSKPEWLLF